MIVLLVYYFWRDWQILNWFLAAYSTVLCLLLVVFMPESPLWLISMNRSKEAYIILKNIAQINGLKNYFVPTKEITINEKNSRFKAKKDRFNFKIVRNLLIPVKNMMKTTILLYIWSALMLIYYGVSLGVLNVDLVDPYLMYFLAVIAEVLGYTICYLNDYFCPKKMITGFFFITTIIYSLIALMTAKESNETSFSAKAIVLMILGLIGKCMISGKL